jgi:hypothetical protein
MPVPAKGEGPWSGGGRAVVRRRRGWGREAGGGGRGGGATEAAAAAVSSPAPSWAPAAVPAALVGSAARSSRHGCSSPSAWRETGTWTARKRGRRAQCRPREGEWGPRIRREGPNWRRTRGGLGRAAEAAATAPQFPPAMPTPKVDCMVGIGLWPMEGRATGGIVVGAEMARDVAAAAAAGYRLCGCATAACLSRSSLTSQAWSTFDSTLRPATSCLDPPTGRPP